VRDDVDGVGELVRDDGLCGLLVDFFGLCFITDRVKPYPKEIGAIS